MSLFTLGHSGTLSEYPLSGTALAKRWRASKFQSAGPDSPADMTIYTSGISPLTRNFPYPIRLRRHQPQRPRCGPESFTVLT